MYERMVFWNVAFLRCIIMDYHIALKFDWRLVRAQWDLTKLAVTSICEIFNNNCCRILKRVPCSDLVCVRGWMTLREYSYVCCLFRMCSGAATKPLNCPHSPCLHRWQKESYMISRVPVDKSRITCVNISVHKNAKHMGIIVESIVHWSFVKNPHIGSSCQQNQSLFHISRHMNSIRRRSQIRNS